MALAALSFMRKDVIVPESAPNELLLQKHADFIHAYEKNKDGYEYVMMEYLRMSGVYWCLTAMDFMHQLDRMSRDEIIDFVLACHDAESGGFAPAADGHDPHLLHTLSAVQILCLLDALDRLDSASVIRYVAGLQQADGSFAGDEWGEIDTRFSFCAVATLSLLGQLRAAPIDLKSCASYVLKCANFDGGFGTRPGSESHAGQIYCCLGTLSILGQLDFVDADRLGWWLAERQLPSGGLNGRPEKLPDVCYSWWVLASLQILGRLDWIDKAKLTRYILASQDEEGGGFADRPEDMADPFHTVFGLAGLSLMGDDRLQPVNPVFCMPQSCIDRLGVKVQLLHL